MSECQKIANSTVEVSLLEMANPYYPRSKLATSKFYGFYIMAYVFGIFLCIVGPLLHYLENGTILTNSLGQILKANLFRDFVGLTICTLYSLISMIALDYTSIQKIKMKYICILPLLMNIFLGILIITPQMYYTDRIFIVVISNVFAFKTCSYYLDFANKQVPRTSLFTKLRYLFSPQMVFSSYLNNHDPTLTIHWKYIGIKLGVSMFCLQANIVLVSDFVEPLLEPSHINTVLLLFKLIPLTFAIHIILYYLVFQNVISALSELQQLSRRVYYHQWWNACNLYQFFQRWCLLVTAFSNEYLTLNRALKHSFHATVMLSMLLEVLWVNIVSFQVLSLYLLVIAFTYFCGGHKLMNNYFVHILCIMFTPFILTLNTKYSIFQ